MDVFLASGYQYAIEHIARDPHECSVGLVFTGCQMKLSSSFSIYALYNRNRWILGGLLAYLLAQTGAGLWQYTVHGASPAPLTIDNYEFHFCIYLPPKRMCVPTLNLFRRIRYS